MNFNVSLNVSTFVMEAKFVFKKKNDAEFSQKTLLVRVRARAGDNPSL